VISFVRGGEIQVSAPSLNFNQGPRLTWGPTNYMHGYGALSTRHQVQLKLGKDTLVVSD
jgi:hypothetical protein